MSRLLSFFTLVTAAIAGSVTYDWDIGWTTAAPDGFSRPVIGINGQWPIPVLECNVGDMVTVNLKNSLGNQTTGIHYHGMTQTGTPQMDGTSMVAQCPVPPGASFTQTFQSLPAGTHWFHSHNKGQYPDGLRAPMIVHDPSYENSLGVDKQFVLTVSDWYHEQTPSIIHKMLTTSFGPQPAVDASLMNDKQSDTFTIQAGKKYLFRIISMSALLAHDLEFEGHDMQITALDGIPCEPYTTSAITLAAGQRYDVVITAKSNPSQNYAIFSKMVGTGLSNTGTLSYSSKYGNAKRPSNSPSISLNDLNIKPKDAQSIIGPVDHRIYMEVKYSDRSVIGRRIGMNDTYVSQEVPTLYTALTTGEDAMSPEIYGEATNPSVIKSNEVVEIVVRNRDGWAHPMHLHGHQFQVVARGSGDYTGNEPNLPRVPMKRDTVATVPNGHLVLRFRADSPGVWLFHCHMEWHVETGMLATIIESPDKLQASGIKIPQQHLDICHQQNIKTEGNCGGNTEDHFDLSKCHTKPDPNETWGALIDHPKDAPVDPPKNAPNGPSENAPNGPSKNAPNGPSKNAPNYRYGRVGRPRVQPSQQHKHDR
ncbi:hypothetical protein LTS18_003301 [Coniosporium uncinatum]|uniref:Uncharacterized protein n=1 Tax=Coniosporium uncinatum TaxID=93489 RepID=A0ACC3D6U3_9PEZI|nr:hypothetical protein LTS18_003301 [Coniosporium uncinatum]